jgi:hypothetical protein
MDFFVERKLDRDYGWGILRCASLVQVQARLLVRLAVNRRAPTFCVFPQTKEEK